jgi:parvulin-like peptidyl-prolyl isomerase
MRRPLLRFAALGALLFAVDLARPEARPDAAALDDDALLFREALAQGLHRSDDVVRRRLVQNLRFARPSDGRSDDALLEEAIALGIHESDLVVRRRLASKMRLRFAAQARADEPSDAELRAYLGANAERFTEPERVAVGQLYFRERARAEAALAALFAGADAAALAGDALPLPRELPSHARSELAARLGPAVADAAFAGPDARWLGPVASPWGHHLLFVRERTPARRSAFQTVRSELREALLAERAEAATRREIAALRAPR